MQNASTTHATGAGQQPWATPSIQNLYPSHQRTTSNPRAYANPDSTGMDRRDEQPVYAAQDTYAYQQQAQQQQSQPQHATQSQQYPNLAYNYQQLNYPAVASPSQPSSSRRTSAPKVSTPPSSAPVGQNSSPSYYAQRQSSTDTAPHTQSPYQPSSAPPQMTHHTTTPQTAHPYGGGYHQYYDQAHYQGGQWPQQHYAQYQQTARPPAQSTTTPTVSQTAALPEQTHAHRTPATASSTSFDYPGQQMYVDQRQNWQTPRPTAPPTPQTMGQPWQGYHVPQHVAPPGNQFPYQQWNGTHYGYPPPSAPAIPPQHSGGGKKEKKKEEYTGLGKRPADGHHPEEEEKDKKKKGKAEEKPVPKPPAKSHLHPPRQAQSAWQLFFTDELNKAKAAAAAETSPGGTVQHVKLNVAQIAKDAGAAYANLSDEQKKYYAGKVQESKEQYARELAEWQATLTPDDIRAENAFRAQQRKEGKSRKGNLKDPNAPKKPLSAYFLFLKGIRENDDLRARVWGEESETTKQSVLAAERWRNLSDDEKKPFLQQAERDKQEYEAARKIYEDDAAARARGEDVPPRPVVVPESKPIPVPKIEAKPVIKAEETLPSFNDYTHDSDSSETEHPQPSAEPASAVDEFTGFSDPLEGMDLGGFSAIAPVPEVDNGHHWDDLTKLMGVNADTSVAPGLESATIETAQEEPVSVPPMDEQAIQDVAQQAEGSSAVPELSPPTEPGVGSGQPTEEVSELPPADAPRVEEELPSETPVQAQTDQLDETEQGNDAFDTAALVGEAIPEAIHSEEPPPPTTESDEASGPVDSGDAVGPALVAETESATIETADVTVSETIAPAQAADADAQDDALINGTTGPEGTTAGDEVDMDGEVDAV
ncbi:hypothetical protein BCR39DRAFT_561920 [Naematelia encephala]|uniref:HMG box domain-containing protein n=1 Tax=Naematelia encephala TaxID=71784 RepID=A0A1Y2ALT9_9TREE|nr:hypothetical protein BCR39DRAFT_561920 [Naematelia encephala]